MQNGVAVEWSFSLEGGEIHGGVFVAQNNRIGVQDDATGETHWLEDCQQMWTGCDYVGTLHRKHFNPVLVKQGRDKIYIWKIAL